MPWESHLTQVISKKSPRVVVLLSLGDNPTPRHAQGCVNAPTFAAEGSGCTKWLLPSGAPTSVIQRDDLRGSSMDTSDTLRGEPQGGRIPALRAEWQRLSQARQSRKESPHQQVLQMHEVERPSSESADKEMGNPWLLNRSAFTWIIQLKRYQARHLLYGISVSFLP